MKYQKIKRLVIINKIAKLLACFFVNSPAAIGRCLVRDINLSLSASITMLKVFAAPAAKVPPINDAIVGTIGGQPLAAKKSAGTVVMMSNSTTLSFIKATYEWNDRTKQDYPAT